MTCLHATFQRKKCAGFDDMMTSAGLNDDFSFKYFSLKEWKPQF